MSERPRPGNYLAPRYWPVWIGFGMLRMVVLLPHPVRLWLGKLIGRLGHAVAGSRRAVVRRNIELCFPELTVDQQRDLARRHFEALGMSVIELGMARWLSAARVEKLVRREGAQHVHDAMAAGHGVILLSAHFTTLEWSAVGLSGQIPPFDAVYRRNRSEFITELLRAGRERHADSTIEKRDIRRMVRNLRDGRPVWYAPDQSFDRKGAVIVQFFGVPCTQTPAASTLARLGKAVVLPYLPRRLDDGTYEMRILPPLENFPTGDDVADTQRYNDLLEDFVRTCPEQYFWIHRKFKNLPEGYPDYYADLDALK